MNAFAQLSGTVVPLLLLAVGFYFSIRLGRWLFFSPRRVLSGMLAGGADGGTSPLKALAVSLAGTLGVGNIVGVASAIAAGGAGAVFWMWVAALLAMPIKYAEVLLGGISRVYAADGRPHGGASYYIKEAIGGRCGRVLAALFAALCVLASLTLGTMLQTNAAAGALSGVFGVPAALVGGVMAALSLAVLARGAERVENACAALVPFVCVLFCVLSLAVLVREHSQIPRAFAAIFAGAFTPRAGTGGVVGVLTSQAVRLGVTRGLVSNEAGCGTAPIAHAAANAKSPVQQGFWGVFEVFVDTVLLCTLTALVILVAGDGAKGDGVMLALTAYGASLGSLAPALLSAAIAFFAFATVLCWSHYGKESLSYLTGSRRAGGALLAALTASSFLGAVITPDRAFSLVDLVLALMTLLNLTALLFSRQTVIEETRRYFHHSHHSPRFRRARKRER